VTGTLLAVPNVSEGRSRHAIDAIAAAFGPPLLNVHADPDHHRSVFTLAGPPGTLARRVTDGAAVALDRVRIDQHTGIHPRVGVIDVAPIVYRSDADRGAACAEALVLADLLGDQLQLPVFLYGILADGRTRAQLRRGGPATLAQRIAAGELTPDFGPRRLHPTGGAVLVAARAPLVAFNVELAAPATEREAKAIAALIREGGGEGLPGLRAIGLWLSGPRVAQVSMNVEDHRATPLATVVEAIRRHAVAVAAELVGLAPAAAFDGFPADLLVRNRDTIEEALTRHQ
jgi:glutamate formiminotransferase/glutamate formiminotransferase/formiminotetrahydrofolate cyclodeaminase